MTRIELSAGLAISAFFAAGPALAQSDQEEFECYGEFFSGSGMAGSTMEEDGNPTCFFDAGTPAEAAVQSLCGQGNRCEVRAITHMDRYSRVVDKVLSVNGAEVTSGGDNGVLGGSGGDPLACPATTFEDFAEAFSREIAVQETFTRWPLDVTSIDAEADPEPAPVTSQIGQDEATYPMILSVDRARINDLSVDITRDENGGGFIRYAGRDSGELVEYFFEKTDDCWQLVLIDDQSM